MAKRKARDLSRKAPKREAYKTILIVCEGEKTEKLYFEDLISTENLSSVNVQVYSGRGSDPKSVVETAIEEKDKQSQHLELMKFIVLLIEMRIKPLMMPKSWRRNTI